jgi:hypothetical protein
MHSQLKQITDAQLVFHLGVDIVQELLDPSVFSLSEMAVTYPLALRHFTSL